MKFRLLRCFLCQTGLLVLLYFEIGIVREGHREQGYENRKQRQANREMVKADGEPDKCFGLVFQSLTRNLGPLREHDLKLGNVLLHPHRVAFGFNCLSKLLKAFLNLYGVEMVLERAHGRARDGSVTRNNSCRDTLRSSGTNP